MRRMWLYGAGISALLGGAILATTSMVGSAEVAGLTGERPPLVKLIGGNIMRFILMRWELNLTPDQLAEMKKIREAHRGEIAAAAQKVIAAKKALGEEVLAEQPDEQKIRAAASKLAEAIGDAAVVTSKIVPQGRKVLTPEQREKIKATRAECLKAEDAYLKEIGVQ